MPAFAKAFASSAFLLAASSLLVLAGCLSHHGPSAMGSSPRSCGNGVLDFDEDCDDGNRLDDDGCSAHCVSSLQWVAADPHAHDDGCEAADLALERLLPKARDAGLGIVSVLLWTGDLVRRAEDFTGTDHPASTTELILHHDVEISGLPADQTGHLMLLGLTPPLDPILWNARSSVAIVEQLRSHRPPLLIGMAHAGWPDPDGIEFPLDPGAPVDLPVHVARGDLDFIAFEIALPKQPEHLDWIALSTWRRLQNSGFRIPLVGASDYPCGNKRPGNTRSYVLIDGAPTYRKYLDAIKGGRVSMALYDEDRLDLRIGAARIGDEVRAGPSITLRIDSELGDADDVRVIVNGTPADTVHVPAGRQVRSLELTLGGSAWIHLRSRRAMTNPIYVLVDGAPIPRAAADLCYLINWIDIVGQESGIDLGTDRAVAEAAAREARAVYVDRLQSIGADGCP